ncbi:MAG: hypothetical protein HC859_13190 [Bacteroidia bacterium]|nr:hypothetical protein [Bacteroidia bacterium]
MAGKSTYLRAVGVNVVLALSGSVVFAKAFTCPLVEIHTGMRNTDSINENQSYFFAELLRLHKIARIRHDSLYTRTSGRAAAPSAEVQHCAQQLNSTRGPNVALVVCMNALPDAKGTNWTHRMCSSRQQAASTSSSKCEQAAVRTLVAFNGALVALVAFIAVVEVGIRGGSVGPCLPCR